MYDDDTETESIEQMATTRRREGILFLVRYGFTRSELAKGDSQVIVKHNQSSYKVRNVLRSGEAEGNSCYVSLEFGIIYLPFLVPRGELVEYLGDNLAEQSRIDIQLGTDRQGKETTHGSLAHKTEKDNHIGEVHLLTAETGKRQLNRAKTIIADKAAEAIRSRVEGIRDAVGSVTFGHILSLITYYIAYLRSRFDR